jgi:LysM repeat protein
MTAIRPVSSAVRPLPELAAQSAAAMAIPVDAFVVGGARPVQGVTHRLPDAQPYRVTVGSGESLSSLGHRFRVYPQVIAAANHVEEGGVHEGQRLEIPGWKHYVVRRGDTLSRILDRDTDGEMSVADVASANHLRDPNHIEVGQVLAIPCSMLRNGRAVADAVAAELDLGACIDADGAAGTLWFEYERGSVPYNQGADHVATVTTHDENGAEAHVPGCVIDEVMHNFLGKFARAEAAGSDLTRYQFEHGAVMYNEATNSAEVITGA